MSTILTRLIGSGHFSDGTVIARPVRPWVVWDGTATRPIAKSFKIVNQELFELDEVTPAQIPPSYIPDAFVPTSTEVPIIIYPDENFYSVEFIQNGQRVLHGYWKIPYDPADDGYTWYNISLDAEASTYPTPRYEDDGYKIYVDSGTMFADLDNVPEGTIVFTTSGSKFWGRTSTTFIPFLGVPARASLFRDYDPAFTLSGQLLFDRALNQHGILGAILGVDTNDPSWNVGLKTLTFGADDYVSAGGLPWD